MRVGAVVVNDTTHGCGGALGPTHDNPSCKVRSGRFSKPATWQLSQLISTQAEAFPAPNDANVEIVGHANGPLRRTDGAVPGVQPDAAPVTRLLARQRDLLLDRQP
jgi:hypothetical protein